MRKTKLFFVSAAVSAIFFVGAVQAIGTKSVFLFDTRLTSPNLQTINMVGKGPSGVYTAMCEAMCIANSSCKAYTRENNTCFLKSSVSTADFVGDSVGINISGVIR